MTLLTSYLIWIFKMSILLVLMRNAVLIYNLIVRRVSLGYMFSNGLHNLLKYILRKDIEDKGFV